MTSLNVLFGLDERLVGIMLAAEAVNVPPVDVGIVNDDGSFCAMRGVVVPAAMEVNKGPLWPIVYNASRRGGRTVGMEGDVMAPFVNGVDEERSVCWVGLVDWEGD